MSICQNLRRYSSRKPWGGAIRRSFYLVTRHQTKKRTFGENHKAEAVWPSFTLWAICLTLTIGGEDARRANSKGFLNLSFNFYLDLFDWTG